MAIGIGAILAITSALSALSAGGNMLFNAVEAKKNREFQREMSSTAYQRSTADMKEAGLNPALMTAGSQPASIPSGSAGSSNAVFNRESITSALKSAYLSGKEKKIASSDLSNAEFQRELNETTSALSVGSRDSSDRWNEDDEEVYNVLNAPWVPSR